MSSYFDYPNARLLDTDGISRDSIYMYIVRAYNAEGAYGLPSEPSEYVSMPEAMPMSARVEDTGEVHYFTGAHYTSDQGRVWYRCEGDEATCELEVLGHGGDGARAVKAETGCGYRHLTFEYDRLWHPYMKANFDSCPAN